MPEQTDQWPTMSDGIPNDASGGADYLQGLARAHPINSITLGAGGAAGPTASIAALGFRVFTSEGVRV